MPYGMMYGGGMMGPGYGWWLWQALIIIFFLLILWWALRQSQGNETAAEILDKRLARGEITTAEHRRLRQEIGR